MVLAQKLPDLVGGGGVQHLLGGCHLNDVAVVHEDDDIGQVQCLLHVVCDENDSLVQLLLQILHLQLEGAPCHGVQGGEGLIHEHHRRGGRQSPEDADALLLAAGHFAGVLVGVLVIGQAHHVQKLPDHLVALVLRPFEKLWHHADVLVDGHVGEQADLLDDIARVPPQLIAVDGGDVLAVQIDMAAVGLDEAVDHLQGGGLAAARGADKYGKLTLLDFKGNVV